MSAKATSQRAAEMLADLDLRPLKLDDRHGLAPVGLALGQGGGALEVAVTRSAHRPAQAAMRGAWHARHAGRAVPLLLVALYDDKAALCGPGGDEPPVHFDLDPGQVERLCRTALMEPDRHAAARFLKSVVPEVESPLPGLRNEGLFATHELAHGVPARRDWQAAGQRSQPLLGLRGRPLLEGLGFHVEEIPGQASVLRIGANRVAIAIFLDRHEATDVASARFSGVSPISYALAKADAENLPYVFVNHGPAIRIYPAASTGTGRRGRTETFIEVHLDLLPTDRAGYLWLLFSGDALTKGGTFDQILGTSADYAADLGKRLRERVYDLVVPDLAMAIAEARHLRRPNAQDLAVTYEMALTALFRLLFIAYAEDKDLLPYRTNDRYRVRSLKQKARELADMRRAGQNNFDDSTTHWDEFARLCRAVNGGHREWGVPAYDGGLFIEDRAVSPVGALLAQTSVPNRAFGPILTNLLVDQSPEGFGPVDFRSLGVREFGTIYEGLLESELSVAETDLAVGADGLYVPARRNQQPAVRRGQVYLHNASGARKATGSYYTKDFAVDHLLDHSLEPALDEHLARLDALEDRRAGEAFFDFRIADIAMGSGHFLVAAVDRIERKLSSYLARRPLPDVVNELARLKAAACEALGVSPEAAEIEQTQLLRRQIARRCIYGVDINPVAVQLARLSLWIHTFVPGLPLSFLDRNIAVGNSLVGIATIAEVEELLGADPTTLYHAEVEQLIGPAREGIARLARLSDANASEIIAARQAWAQAKHAVWPTEAMFDILAASRLPEMDYRPMPADFEDMKSEANGRRHRRAREVLKDIPPFHFPIAFPEVFLRDRAGFDVIVGNPPWEEATLEEDDFWARYAPGIQALPQHEQEDLKRRLRRQRPDLVTQYEDEVDQADALRGVLVTGPFPGMGTGDPDLYKAFCWRFWNLVSRNGGRLGVVLPRSAFSVKGSMAFRQAVFAGASANLTFLVNNRQWVFPEVHPQYTIALACIARTGGAAGQTVSLLGPFRSLDNFQKRDELPPARFPAREVLTWTDTAALPLLPAEGSAEVFSQLRKSPRLDLDAKGQWRARPHRELDATNDKPLMDMSEKRPRGYWPVFKGESFDIWERDTGRYYAWADPKTMRDHLESKRQRGRTNSNSPFFEFADRPEWFKDQSALPCLHPRIAFRDVTNRTNQRTVLAALVPSKVFIANQAPYLLWPRGDERDQAFLLGVLCSIPLDWYARRFVETHVNFHILNALPIPRPGRDNPLWQRVAALAGRLACPDDRFAEWAEAVGVQCGPLAPDEKDDMICELDAVVAHLYGLSEAHLVHIFETFHEGWDYRPRLEGVLRYYVNWKVNR